MNEEEKKIVLEKLDYRSKLRGLTEETLYKLIEIYYNDSPYVPYDRSFDVEPYYMGLKFYKDVYPDLYKEIAHASEVGKIHISPSLAKSTTAVKTRDVYINLKGDDHDAFACVHECAHYIDLNNPNKYTNEKDRRLHSESFAFYMEKQFEKYLMSLGYFFPVSDHSMRNANSLSCHAEKLNDYLYLSSLYKKIGYIPGYEYQRMINILEVDSKDPKFYLSRYLIAGVTADRLENVRLEDYKKELDKLSLEREIDKKLTMKRKF